MLSIGGHERAYQGITNEWLTPPDLLGKLGKFDLDPCSPINRPWDTAEKHYTIEDDGLNQLWNGRVWLNPPYGPEAAKWLKKMSEHNYGTTLIFARTETEYFYKWVWMKARAVLFIKSRLHFYTVDGKRAKGNAGAPSVLVAYGEEDSNMLNYSGIEGKFLWV
jgi:hypothetical protein